MIAKSLVVTIEAPDRLRAIGRERMIAQYGSAAWCLHDLAVDINPSCGLPDDPCACTYAFRDGSWIIMDHVDNVIAWGSARATPPAPDCECARDAREARRARSSWQYLGDGRAW